MGRAPYFSALAFVATIGAALLSLGASLNYLGRTAHEVAVAATGVDGRKPSFIDSLEPLPPGSINAIMPLPGQQRPAPPVTEATTAALPPPAAEAARAVPAPTPAPAAELIAVATPQVATPQVEAAEPPPASAASTAGRVMLVTSGVNVRDRPSNNSRVIGTVPGGARVAVTAEQQGWFRVEGDGRSGWVYRRFLRPAN